MRNPLTFLCIPETFIVNKDNNQHDRRGSIQVMNAYDIYKLIEFVIFSLYLIFIFLSIQIWFLWKDIDKEKLQIKTFVNEPFFKRNCIYVLFFTIFFIIHEFIEGTNIPNAVIYFEFFEMLGFISIALFSYEWYAMVKTCAYKKSLPQELTNLTKEKV